MPQDFRSYNSAVQDLLAGDVWRRIGEDERLEELVEKIREHHRELADEGALPALVFVQMTGRVTSRGSALVPARARSAVGARGRCRLRWLRSSSQRALDPGRIRAGAEDGEASVWIVSVARSAVLEGGELLIELPLQVDAVGLRRHRAPEDLEQLVRRVIAEFAEETPGVELVDVATERIGWKLSLARPSGTRACQPMIVAILARR
jgi:hypothetical protein